MSVGSNFGRLSAVWLVGVAILGVVPVSDAGRAVAGGPPGGAAADAAIERIMRDGRLVTTVRRTPSPNRSEPEDDGMRGAAVPLNGDFAVDLSGWIATELGGSITPGTVAPVAGRAEFLEGDSFLITLEQTFVMPAGVSILSFEVYFDPGFDLGDNFIPDAFEVSLLDAGFNSVVPTWDALATSFFNVQEDLSLNLGPATQFDGVIAIVDVSGVAPGTVVTLFFDLIGADADTGSGVQIDNVVLGNPASEDDPERRGSTGHKGSLLFWPDVEVQYDSAGQLALDTILELTNDSNNAVYVQLYFVNGDLPLAEQRSQVFPFELLERAHTGWNFVDTQIWLSPHKPTYWSSATGNNSGADSLQVPPFSNLDADPVPPGNPAHFGHGRADPDQPDRRTVRGYVVGWAVAISGEEVTHNELTGSAQKVDLQGLGAWEYDAVAFRRLVDVAGDGALDLDGIEYGLPPARLILDFYATPTNIGAGLMVVDTDLTLLPVGMDFRPGGEPITTFVQADIWNQNEDRFSGAGRCVTCWDQTYLRRFNGAGVLAGNHFLRANIGTDRGKARLTGKPGGCPDAQAAGLLGTAVKMLTFGFDRAVGPSEARAGSTLRMDGAGPAAAIIWDLVD